MLDELDAVVTRCTTGAWTALEGAAGNAPVGLADDGWPRGSGCCEAAMMSGISAEPDENPSPELGAPALAISAGAKSKQSRSESSLRSSMRMFDIVDEVSVVPLGISFN